MRFFRRAFVFIFYINSPMPVIIRGIILENRFPYFKGGRVEGTERLVNLTGFFRFWSLVRQFEHLQSLA